MTPEQRETFVHALRANPGVVGCRHVQHGAVQAGQTLALFQLPGQSGRHDP